MKGFGVVLRPSGLGFCVLESFRGMDFGVENGGGDKDFALLVLEVVATCNHGEVCRDGPE